MPYTIIDQRELMKKAFRDTSDIERYGFVLKYWSDNLENCSTRICFPTQQDAEEYLLLLKLTT